MPRQVDCSRSNVDVHEIVDDPALDVAFVFVNQNLWNSHMRNTRDKCS